MIEIRSIQAMADRHRTGEVPFRILQEIAFVLLCIGGHSDIAEATAVTQQEVDWLLALPEKIELMAYMGGNAYICETEDDLMQVTGMDFEFSEQHGRWPNCTEAVLALDECKYLLNADGSSDYALLFAATNNAGGSSWFIPQKLWQAAQIQDQIKANQQFWRDAQ